MPSKETWMLILDGKKYTEGRFEEGITLSAYICLPVKGRSKNKVQGFSKENLFLDWATKEGIGEVAEKCIKRVARERKRLQILTNSEMEKVERDQAKKVKKETSAVANMLKRKKVKPNDAKKLVELARKGEIGSIFLYDHTWFRSPYRYLTAGAYWRLSRFGWNDRTESAIDLSTGGSILYQHTFFRGVAFFMPPYAWIPNFAWFNNRTSSAVVMG